MRKYRVVVAVSGGVDSAIAALLLKNKGYETIGLTLKLYSCFYNPSIEMQIEDAKMICKALNIKHIIINLEKAFQERIINYFRDEYLSGLTPNPCTLCNRIIKFETLLKVADEIGADYIATGHYANIVKDDSSNIFYLERALNKNKDQSYFLYRLNQKILARTIFPLGSFYKENVRKIAEKYKIHVHDKKDSNEICFIGDKDYRTFFRRIEVYKKRGLIIDKNGKTLGYHNGVYEYTIGQRKGLGISHSTPLYVLQLNSKENTVIVGERKDLLHSKLIAEDLNWIYKKAEIGKKYFVKIRSIHIPALARVAEIDSKHIKLIFDAPQWAITAGQSVVLYEGNTVIGGGIITYGG